MVGDEPHDALAVGGIEPFARVGEAVRKAVDPEPPVWVQHHLDDDGIVEEAGDGGAERRAQHPCATRSRLRSSVLDHACHPVVIGPHRAALDRGRVEEALNA